MTAQFYHFRQNNSGGDFTIDDIIGIGPHVYIQANSVEEAMERAEKLGIYFNGCDSGRDCSCCGDRWSEPWDSDASDLVVIDDLVREYFFMWHEKIYVHPLEGPFVAMNRDGDIEYIQTVSIEKYRPLTYRKD